MNEDELRSYAVGLEDLLERIEGLCDDVMDSGEMREKRLARSILRMIND